MADPQHDLTRLRIDRSPARTGSRWTPVLVILLLALLSLVAWQWWGGGAAGGGPPTVAVARVQRTGGASATSGTSANGYVVARRRAALSTTIQGRIIEMRVEEGDLVQAGDVVARLDTAELEAGLAATNAQLAEARAQADLAESEYQRLSRLNVPVDITQFRLDETTSRRLETRARVESLEALVAQTEVRLRDSSVYAPFDGIIVEKNAEVGEVVSAIGATGPNARGAVATLVDRDTLEVQVELAQTSLGAAREDAPVVIYLDAFPDDGYRGKVRQIWPTADRTKATVELRVVFLERDERILPEMGVRVVFVRDESQGPAEVAVYLPERALAGAGDDRFVFVLAGDAVSRRPVRVEPDDGGRLKVLEGLTGGELVVLDPPADLVDGALVRRLQDA